MLLGLLHRYITSYSAGRNKAVCLVIDDVLKSFQSLLKTVSTGGDPSLGIKLSNRILSHLFHVDTIFSHLPRKHIRLSHFGTFISSNWSF